MSSFALSPELSCPQDDAADDALHYRAMLRRLADMGEAFAGVVQQQAVAQPATAAAAAAATPFNTLCRNIRQSILLAHKLAEPRARSNRAAARRQIIRGVEDAIQREAEDIHEAEALEGELLDRLDRLDIEDDIDARPIDDVIADIVHDLGLEAPRGTHPWKRRTPDDVAVLVARATKGPTVARGPPIHAP